MESRDELRSEPANETSPPPARIVPAEAPTPSADRTAHSDHQAGAATRTPPHVPPPPAAKPPAHRLRKWLILAGVVVGLAVAGYFVTPWVVMALNTVSTDDAYVNS